MDKKADKPETIIWKIKAAILCAAALCITACLSFVCLKTRAYFYQSREYTAGTVVIGSFTETDAASDPDTDPSPALLMRPGANAGLSSGSYDDEDDTPLKAVSIEKEAKKDSDSKDQYEDDRTEASSGDTVQKNKDDSIAMDGSASGTGEKTSDGQNSDTASDGESDDEKTAVDTDTDTDQENTDRIEVDSWDE